MKVRIRPYTETGKIIAAPPSKSMAHRHLIAAGLADGVSLVRNVAMSEDITATIGCLRALGAKIDVTDNADYIEESGIICNTNRDDNAGETVMINDTYKTCESGFSGMAGKTGKTGGSMTLRVRGADPFLQRERLMTCGESGSTLRFMIPLCALSGARAELTGSRRLMERPMSVYEDIMALQGVSFERTDTSVCIEGRISGGVYRMPGNISSQFVSGLLFTLPLCDKDSIIRIEGGVQSRPYIDMTIAALKEHGISVRWVKEPNDSHVSDDSHGSEKQYQETSIEIPGRQRYRPVDVTVEGDWSNAANLMALGAEVTGLDPESLQGDRVCAGFFRMLDEGPAELDITDCPDLGPVLMAYAAVRHGAVLIGTDRLRYKESDRGAAMQAELSKFGIKTCISENSIKVGCGASAPAEVLDGHNDHRIVMALAAVCARTGGCIDGAEAVRKSFPDYFEKICELGVETEEVK